jgi:hypothetical protein
VIAEGEEARLTLARHSAAVRIIEEKFGDGEPYEFERMLRRAEACKLALASDFIELGRVLIQVKAHEPHGKFAEAVARLGIEERSARRYMAVAMKFGETRKLRALPLNKLDVLAQISEGELKQAETVGEIAGATIEDIDRMTPAELRDLVRRYRGRERKASTQMDQVRRENDYLRQGTGVRADFDRLTGGCLRCLAALHNLELGQIDLLAADFFMALLDANREKLRRRLHPDDPANLIDGDVELGKLEKADRDKVSRLARLKDENTV